MTAQDDKTIARRSVGAALQTPLVRRISALVRMVIGLFFANEAIRKISQGWLVSGADMIRTVQTYPTARSGGYYHWFVANVVLPHAALFAPLVTLGECTVAISLTLGLFTRLGALTALWLNLNFLLLKGPTNPSARIDWLFLLANILIAAIAAGRTWGLDGLFRAKFSRIPIAGWFAGNGEAQSTRPFATLPSSPPPGSHSHP